jgi:hypothetical protein
MKVIKFIKKNKKWCAKWFLVFGISITMFLMFHNAATEMRNYEAIGGEIFLLFLPLAVYEFPKTKKDIKQFLGGK